MSLPHPHGNASGQIGNNAIYDTGVTPGSTGGKFIGFGEEGTSAIANRAHWALSENINYVYGKLAADLAMPQIDSWTVAGGVGLAYTFIGATKVWCGDGSYPSGQEGLDRLFSLLDANYNQLTAVDGNKVVVRTVRDGSDVDIFGTGFNTTPVIKFKTVNPFTGADVTNPYTIPDGTVVKIVHSRVSSLENLSIDAFTKIPVRVAEEVPAGVILQDGTRPMTGNLNLNGHNLNNFQYLYGKVGVTARVQTPSDDLELISGANLRFMDSRKSAYLTNLGEATDIGFSNTSVMGSLSNAWMLGASMHGNRCRTKSGSFTFTNGSGRVDYPALDIILNGDRRQIAGGFIMATSGSYRILVVNSSGTVVERAVGAVVSTDLPFAAYLWSGATFVYKFDARWPLSQRTAAFEITVGGDGSGGIIEGCDFADLDSAFSVIAMMQSMSATGRGPQSYVIRLRGTVLAPNPLTMWGSISILGEGDTSTIKATHAVGAHTIDCASWRLEIRNIRFMWANAANQSADYAAINDMATGSIASNCSFWKDSSKGYANAFGWRGIGYVERVLIEQCYADVSQRFVMGAGIVTLPSATQLMNSTIRNCYVCNWTGSLNYMFAIDAGGSGMVVENCIVDGQAGTGFYFGIRIGHNGLVYKCRTRGRDVTTWAYGICFQTNDPSVTSNTGTIVYNQVENVQYGIAHTMDVSYTARKVCLMAQGNRVMTTRIPFWVDCDSTASQAGSEYWCLDNVFDGIGSGGSGRAIFAKNARLLHARGNKIRGNLGYIAHISDNTEFRFSGNDVEGFVGTGIWLTSTAGGHHDILNNSIRSTGATGAVQVQLDCGDCLIQGNYLTAASGEVYTGIWLNAVNDVRIESNYFSGQGQTGGGASVHGAINARDTGVARTGLAIRNNTFSSVLTGSQAIEIRGYRGTVIENNQFVNCDCICVNVWDNSLYAPGLIIKGNSFTSCSGWNGVVSPGNGFVIIVSSANVSSGYSIEGNTFSYCGNASRDVSTAIISAGSGPGSIRGNVFKDCPGYWTDTSNYLYLIHATGHAMIQGNYFHMDLVYLGSATAMARNFTAILGDWACSITDNQLVLEGTLSGFTGCYFRFIDTNVGNDCVVSDNMLMHWPGSLSGSGSDIQGITATGFYNIITCNRILNGYGMATPDGTSVNQHNLLT